MKLKPSTIAIIIMIGLIAILEGLSKLTEKKDIGNTPVEVASSTTMIIRKIEKATSTIEITIEYPEFSNQPILNARIKKEAEDLFTQTNTDMDQSVQAITETESAAQRNPLLFQKTINKEKVYINDTTGIISVVYDQYTDTGGAHGMFFFGSDTYDMRTAAKLTLSDFLQNYEDGLRTYIKNKITETSTTSASCVRCEYLQGSVYEDAEFISPMFYVSQEGIAFLYGAYDLGAYAITSAGQEIVVSMDILKNMIKRKW